ncbi:ABC transporter ATP-binding protein [Pseudoalteromonas phenolica]|uniref:ABC transporter ATP-binding protein n=1 Tax=Pseudoalteromonas phenolica TaxID=161398 RepID=A0A5R9Q0R6_9GAMM|nr:ABC transporter ATP-binding protein [Pseudoalteromonas phenolica]TLX46750.1 ABC transporter ATP-binding protein [Pseudoalteromonas phenolica]
MSDVLIRLSQLGKCFSGPAGDVTVLKNINLAIERGEILAVIGKSGSGKSTLLSIIGLLDNATAGHYALCDTDVRSLSHYQTSILRNQNIGWVFQNFNLVSELSVLKNVELPLKYNKNIKKTDYKAIALKQLERVGLLDKQNNFPEQLSGGQQQRVAIARALVGEPDVLLCDEPTGNLDSENADQIVDLLLTLNAAGSTVLIVTHNESLAQQCGRIIEIKDGMIV